MTQPPMAESGPGAEPTPLAQARHLVQTATGHLLGDTIAVSDEQWRAPSRLPRWNRGHVATHLARHADALVRLCGWARTGAKEAMYASNSARDEEIEAGADRSGLELQIDLDTSSGHVAQAFDEVDAAGAWDARVELRGGLAVPARLLPLSRLTEVVLHHIDLDIGAEIDGIDETTAAWLLEWSEYRLRHRDEFPRLRLVADSGLTITVGSSGAPRTVHGTSARLLGWLTSRAGPDDVSGADGLHLPPF
jgi:maleylpyruvate isomerase